jgi:hypothetical protein
LINAPVGALLLVTARRRLPPMPAGPPRRLDLLGAGVLGAALLALVTPLTFGREAGWPAWAWACLASCVCAFLAFVAVERAVRSRGRDPLFDLRVLELPGVSAGVVAIVLIMGCYAGFLLSLTIHLQDGLGFTPLRAGVVFVAYAAGFATASLTWMRVPPSTRDRLPLGGPLAMAAALLAVGLVASGGSCPVALASPLLFVAGVGHACDFSPLANRLTSSVQTGQIADLSGLIITASLVGSVLGVATFAGIYLGGAADGSARAFAVTTAAIAAVLLVTAACAVRALAPTSAAQA